MVTIKKRFRGVKQNLKRYRALFGKQINYRFWKKLKIQKRLKYIFTTY